MMNIDNNGWLKIFLDGSMENGSDYKVKNKLASWSKGRLDNLVNVLLTHDNFAITISGFGNYWQSDDLEVETGNNYSSPKYVMRRIQKQINESDNCIYMRKTNNVLALIISKQLVNKDDVVLHSVIDETMIGKWITLEFDTIKKDFNLYLSQAKI